MLVLNLTFSKDEMREFLKRRGYTFESPDRLKTITGEETNTFGHIEYALKGENPQYLPLSVVFENEMKLKMLE